jgi:leucyl-tRNA synthetase
MAPTKQLPNYNHAQTEQKWQKFWEDEKIFKYDEKSKKPKHYTLEMFFYPSGKMHMGHLRNFTIGDVVARNKRMYGFNVLHPMGADAFGLPAENAAIKAGLHPKNWTKNNIAEMMKETQLIGLSYDLSRQLATCDVEYYGQQQKLFIDFLNAGIAYQKESLVNWDPVDQTVLANEQVINGRGWRSDAIVERKKIKQWFFKTTKYTEELLEYLDRLPEWPEKIKLMQKNWIGKSEGARVDFKIVGSGKSIEVYTTRPDTLFGASFIAISPNHPIAQELAEKDSRIAKFVKECTRTTVDEETIETMEKKGLDTGLKVTNPFDESQELPIYIANFVLIDYGTGAIFGCPAHDQRDFEFATKYKLPIKTVVSPEGKPFTVTDEPFMEGGVSINSDFLNGLLTTEAITVAIAKLQKLGYGKGEINYRLRDWGVSRQRYWGCPIPVIYCEKCGIVPVDKKDLPVILPEDVVFDGKGNPLENHPTWKQTKCPHCKGKATRETDTLDTFVDSAWYFMRYCDVKAKNPINKELCEHLLPVDQYVGGAEHATMHLIYSRFFTKAMRDLGYVKIDEPFTRLFNQGIVCHKSYKDENGNYLYPDEVEEKKDGSFICIKTGKPVKVSEGLTKMSKSKNNVIEPKSVVGVYGADATRLFMMSDNPADKEMDWTEKGLEACWRYINKLWKLTLSFTEEKSNSEIKKLKKLSENPDEKKLDTNSLKIIKQIHKTIKEVTNFYNNMEFNRAIAKIRELSNSLEKAEEKTDEQKAILYLGLKTITQILAPITPHISCELWEKLGNKEILDTYNWPIFNEELTSEDTVTIAIQVNGKLKGTIEVLKGESKETIEKLALENKLAKQYIADRQIRKTIVVPDKIVNFVV